QHYQPGGSCGAFRRNGVTFDQGTAMLYGFGSTGSNNPHRYIMSELEEEIEVIKHEMLYCLKYDGTPIHFHSDMDAYFKELEQLFDEDEMTQLRSFYSYIGRLYHKVLVAEPICVAPPEIPPKKALQLLLKSPIRQIKTIGLLKKSAGDIVRPYIKSERVIKYLNKLTSTYCYTLVDETPAIMAATMFMDNHFGGVYYPTGSSQQLPGKLEKAIEKFGGRIFYQHNVKQILFDGDRACGILAETTEGEVKFDSDAVVYAGTVWDLYGKLIPEEVSDPITREWAKNIIPTYPSLVLHCLVDEEVIPEGTQPIQMLADNPDAIDEKEITLYILSLADPSICPPGTHTVMAIGPSLREWPSPRDPDYRSSSYEKAKEEETERILITLEKHLPGFRKALRYNTLASPSTIERYTMKPGGSVTGPKHCMGQELLKRPHARTKWENLFMCGESTVMGTGSPSVTISGISAANMVLRRLGKKEYIWRRDMKDYVKEYRVRDLPKLNSPYHIRANALENEKYIKLHDDASLCQWCEDAPCLPVCPAEYDIRGVLRRIEVGNYQGAYSVLGKGNGEKKANDINCINCPAHCDIECKDKNGSVPPVKIKNTFLSLARLLKNEMNDEK
ncbi:MAG: FAD-dependent oxidoreductase, partial [Marinilabiliaceae bacterium]|nr:FAD-dependent oxidoreductase [Marinilabiliaceae bacterium]